MRYVSTRGGAPAVGFAEAVAAGLAPDGGLFVPEELPDFSRRAGGLRRPRLPRALRRFLARFATDIPGPSSRDSRRSLVTSIRTPGDRAAVGALGRASTCSSSSTGRRSPSRTSPSNCSATSTRGSARSAGRRSTSWAPPRATRGRRRSTGSWARRAPRSSSSTRTAGSRRCRSARWRARGPRTSTRSPSTGPSTTPRPS